MVSGDQIQQILNDPLGYAVEYRSVLLGAALVAAAFLAFAIGTVRTRKPEKRRPVLAPYFPEPAAEQPQQIATEPYLEPGAKIPPLPLPQPHDLDYARTTLKLAEVSSKEGRQLYFDGAAKKDLHMAMTGLRFYTQFIVDGGYRNYTSPWREYKDLAEFYLNLARMHNSRQCLELARNAFAACDMTIYPEPSTERVSREVLQNLQLLNHELAVRPGA